MKFAELGLEMPAALYETAVLWGLFYLVLKALKGTRAMQVVWFIGILLVLTHISRMMNLMTVHWVLTSAQMPIFVGLVILYAPEFRRAVANLSGKNLFRRRSRSTDNPIVVEVTQAVLSLSKRRIGALIVFERSANLQGFIETGIKIESHISAELLVSIFSPLTPLHDGAVIIRNGQIAAAACLLPLSQREEIDSALGTRHRAALGLAEETDAVTVVVSEESGGISMSVDGKLTRELQMPTFQRVLANKVQGSLP